MADPWIKMRVTLDSSPQVVRIASALNADTSGPLAMRTACAVGLLHRTWSLADIHSEDGVLIGYDRDTLDSIIGVSGWSSILERVGWLEVTDEGITFPGFERHNGASAKRRAKEAERKRASRKKDESGNAETSASCPHRVRPSSSSLSSSLSTSSSSKKRGGPGGRKPPPKRPPKPTPERESVDAMRDRLAACGGHLTFRERVILVRWAKVAAQHHGPLSKRACAILIGRIRNPDAADPIHDLGAAFDLTVGRSVPWKTLYGPKPGAKAESSRESKNYPEPDDSWKHIPRGRRTAERSGA